MSEIMICCPTFGTETIVPDLLEDLPIPMRCPACMKLHKWQRKDASWSGPFASGVLRFDA
jgi:hypothetical protein